MTDYEDPFAEPHVPTFYLPRLVGGKLAILLVTMVLYLSIRHQLTTHLNAGALTLGLAHAEANVMLAVFGHPDTVTTFGVGRKTYDLTRLTIARADLFAQCWRAVLGQIERGTILAVAFVLAPPLAWYPARAAWQFWQKPDPAPNELSPALQWKPKADIVLDAVPPLPNVPAVPQHICEDVEEPVLPTLAVRARVQPAAKPDEPVLDTPPLTLMVEPGQIRKRPTPEV